MLDLVLLAFILGMLALGLRRPFIWVLTYLYIDIVAPQKIGWGIIQAIPLSFIAFIAAFTGWALFDSKEGSRFTFRQGLILALLLWCGWTTLNADFPVDALTKWDWVWKALIFAIFLPLTLRTKLRIEAAALVMAFSVGAIIISGGIKTILSGGGYGTLSSLVQSNEGLYEGSTLSMVAISVIPLFLWVARHGTIFPKSRWTILFAAGLIFAALLVPVGTQTRTGLVCIAVLGVLMLRSVKNRFLYAGLGAVALMAAIPFLPQSFTERMETISNPEGDESASTRLAVWQWTIDYVGEKPLGGGFDAFRGNSFTYRMRIEEGPQDNSRVRYEKVTDEGRAYHSSYFEVLGEQGWPGLALWLWIHALGLWQMERIRRRMKARETPEEKRWYELATALQHGQAIYLVGALFVGIAYQPFVFYLVALQIALASLLSRKTSAKPKFAPKRPGKKVTEPTASSSPGEAPA